MSSDLGDLRKFTFAIYHRLPPREIRDMIYAYLFDHVEPIYKRFDFDNQVDALGHRFDITEYRKHCPWFLDTALVFPGFASEAVKMLYQVSAHYIGAPTTVMEHMDMDVFGVGVTPGSVAIKTIILQIRIKPVNYGKICEQLDFLPSIKVGNEFMLHVHLDHTERFKLAQLFSVIKKAESALKYFKDEGHKVDIMYNWDSLWSFSIDKFPNWTMDLLDKELLGFVPGIMDHGSRRRLAFSLGVDDPCIPMGENGYWSDGMYEEA